MTKKDTEYTGEKLLRVAVLGRSKPVLEWVPVRRHTAKSFWRSHRKEARFTYGVAFLETEEEAYAWLAAYFNQQLSQVKERIERETAELWRIQQLLEDVVLSRKLHVHPVCKQSWTPTASGVVEESDE